ncbi:glutamate--tRNA ligase [Desulfurivibrio alkaliphilus]|uniref:Glutamate--tRNA ligase n=1 Tax=Desulfurivibrio alkaliphilus (strain DSM 19089 / UNIQEM U267 / AHT2) TaxID=589865 RepID=D6Z0I4_DESAT|nr:glutamate--tRNA ligase [Desulfurivibrio alkaliphilus]ADH85213.1 glutamyl-tRNA synthetase [Desulfurivibrio alkaliphilus AHT 2]
MSEVRVRFPPSPTGYLHIGGARTAIYNWLFAKKHGGKMVLRIEDTDAERSTEESIRGIIDGMEWLGLDWDEGPYFQTDHADEHRAAAAKLLAGGQAYKCFCSKEELEARREAAVKAKADYRYNGACRDLSPEEAAAREAAGTPYVIRFKVPQEAGLVAFKDEVYGGIERSYQDIEDFVIVRSNGQPLYLLCNVVDDIRDKISHVIRGQDGLANTPRQILLYRALGANPPTFAHMPLTLDLNKAKISKRSHGEVVAVQFYREQGFISWALVNFLVLLGWSPGDDREIFSKEELIEAFSLAGISKANSIFNYRKDDPKFFTDPKAININAHYLRTIPVSELASLVRPFLEQEKIWDPAYQGEKKAWFEKTLEMTRERFHTLKDFTTLGRAWFADDFTVDDKAREKNLLKHPQLQEWLPELADRLAALPEITPEEAERVARELAEAHGVKPGIPINGARAVITGQIKGPSMFEVFAHLERDKVIGRLREAGKYFA